MVRNRHATTLASLPTHASRVNARLLPPRDSVAAVMLRTACVALLALLSLPSIARAQSGVESGWALDRFDPAPQGDGFLLAEHPRYARAWGLALGATLEVATAPLVLQRQYADRHFDELSVVSSMFVAHVGAATSFAGRFGVDLVLPVALAQAGTEALLGTVVLGPAAGAAVGDLRVGGRARIVGHAGRDPFSLHLGVWLWLPTGSREGNTGDGALRVEPRIIMAGAASIVRWSLTSGVMVRRAFDALNVALGPELRVTAAVGLELLRGRLRVGPEAYLVSPLGKLPDGVSSAFFASGQWGLEALLGAHVALPGGLLLGVGGGMGFERSVGVPAARFALSFAWRGPSRDASNTLVGIGQ